MCVCVGRGGRDENGKKTTGPMCVGGGGGDVWGRIERRKLNVASNEYREKQLTFMTLFACISSTNFYSISQQASRSFTWLRIIAVV